MKTISRYIMTLALLLTAVGGAWAQAPTIYFQQDYSTETVDWTTGTGGRYTPIIEDGYLTVNQNQRNNNGTTLTCTATQGKVDAGKDFTMTFNVKLGASDNQDATEFNIYDGSNSGYILSLAEGSAGATAWTINGGTQTATVSAGGGKSLNELSWIFVQVTFIAGENAKTYLTLKDDQNNIIDGFDKTEIPTISVAGGLGKMNFVTSRRLANFAIDNVLVRDVVNDDLPQEEIASDVEVTTNAAEGETTFTEASFNMPAYDATAEYELVRDMSIQMTATMGDGTNGVRYRVKKAQQGEGYEPADMDMMQVLALVAVNDGIEQKALTLNQDYFCRIYKLDEQTLQPEGDGVKLADFDFAPGLYALKAFANDGSNYDGETALSNTFQLFQGYEITVPAGEFITYYKDEPLRIEDQEADLYTIQSVSADQAVLSSPSDAMPSNTPMLVYNKSNETKVILLIPCAEPDLAITVAPEFQGTLTGTTIAASTEGQTNYAFNGKAFVFVKNDLAIGANKAWLSVNTGEPSARITLVFDDATGVNGVIGVKEVNDGSWYDLNGRKLDKMPTKKGVYLFNGKKVVVK